MARIAGVLERAAAGSLALCSITLHKVSAAIERPVTIPLRHIVDPTVAAVKRAGATSVSLLATGFSMEAAFYVDRLRQFRLEVMVPGAEDRARVHRIIIEELCRGRVRDKSRRAYRSVLERRAARGAEGVILGRSGIAMLISPADSTLPVSDTTCTARGTRRRMGAHVSRTPVVYGSFCC